MMSGDYMFDGNVTMSDIAKKLDFQGSFVWIGGEPFGLKSIFETDFKRHSEPRLPSTAQINH